MRAWAETDNVQSLPKLEDVVFYPYSSIDNAPIVCHSDVCNYICIFLDYFPSAYPHVIEPCSMAELLDYALKNKVDRFVISSSNEAQFGILLDDYIKVSGQLG